ncbi:MAG: response regulator transcription factor [Candidatus Dormibacteria bacterium]
MAIRVVLAEDSYLVREGIRQLLEEEEGIELVASCDDLDSVNRAIAELRPDVVLTDIRMPPSGTDEGLQVAHRLRREAPEIGVVVLSQYVEAEYALALLESGAAGRAYLLKERVSDVGQLRHAIEEVHRGGSVIDPRVVEALVEARSGRADSPIDSLTPREREVLGELAQGRNNAAIASGLFLTERAVEKHINSIFSKLGLGEEPDVHRRVKATLVYLGRAGS